MIICFVYIFVDIGKTYGSLNFKFKKLYNEVNKKLFINFDTCIFKERNDAFYKILNITSEVIFKLMIHKSKIYCTFKQNTLY